MRKLQGWNVNLVIFIICSVSVQAAELRGHVTNENDLPVAGARVTVHPPVPGLAAPVQTQTNPDGAFSLTVKNPGDYLVDVDRQGYYQMTDRPVHIQGTVEVTLVVNTVREVFQSVDVNGKPSPVDITQPDNQERLTGTEVNDVPYPSTHSFRNSLRLLPGVVQDASGALHFNGSSENQVQYQLNGFNLTDPITGEFRTNLAVEGIRSVDYSSGRYSPEYGKGSAGVLAIRTENGTDAFHYTATDFIPGVDIQQGLRLGSWYPRFGISGPIVRGSAWFSDTFDSEYNTALVTGLPSGQNTRSGWAGSNLLHTQFNLTPRNILFADFLVNIDNENRYGLGALDPVSTTLTYETREYFGSLRDQIYFGHGALVEFGYAHNQFALDQTPQGQNPYIYSTTGRSGNYFVTSTQGATRDEGLIHGYAPQFHFFGTHEIEAGTDIDALHYDGDFHRTGYQVVGLAGQVLFQTSFTGPGVFGVDDRQIGEWVLDTWRLSKRLQVNAGFREDWDQLVGAYGASPRLSFSWAPFKAGHTRVAGGFSVTHDEVPLDPFGRILDQTALTTVPGSAPAPTTFARGPSLKIPRATNWNLTVDHEVSEHLFLSANYLRRRGTDGFNFINTSAPDAPPSLLPLPNGASAGTYDLANLRRDDYDSAGFSVRQTFTGQYEWMASYTRSRAQTNALIDVNTPESLAILPAFVPMPWDSPNRFLGWFYLPLPFKKWAISGLADARTGFPFSVQQETALVAGPVNSHRYPFNFDLNLAIERMVTLRGYRFALRGGVNNLTNQLNPTAVNNTIGSPQYLQFLGFEGRHFVVRIRFFGRAGAK